MLATLPDCLPESVAEALIAAGIVPLLGIDDALAAAEAAADIGAAQAAPVPAALAADVRLLGEPERWTNGGQAAPGRVRHRASGRPSRATPAEAVRVAEALGYPVVVKAVGQALAHKSELGAVALGLRDAGAVRCGRPAWRVWARRCWSSLWSTTAWPS